MDARTQALQEIVAKARQHQLTAVEIAAALGGGTAPPRETGARAILVRALGYLGGTFVFAGIAVFVALQWDAMNSAGRVVITLGSGVAAFVLAVLASRDPRFEKAGTPLVLVAAALEPTGMLVAFDEYGRGGDWRWAALVTCGTIGCQFAAALVALRRSTLLFLTIAFALLFWLTVFDLLDADSGVTLLVLGASLLAASFGIDRTAHRVVTPPWYLIGSGMFLYGLFDQVKHTPFEILFLAAAAAFVYASVTVHSRTLLFVATVAILAYTGWFTGEHFADSVGWPIALVAFGLFMIGLSAAAFRIDREYVRARR